MIIAAPAAVPRWVHRRDAVLTLVLWAAYVYLMADVIVFAQSMLVWLFQHRGAPGDLPRTFHVLVTLGYYGLIALGNGAAFWGWSHYNRQRFRGKERRKPMPAVTAAEIAERYQVRESDLERWRDSRIVVVHHGEEGRIAQVETRSAPATA